MKRETKILTGIAILATTAILTGSAYAAFGGKGHRINFDEAPAEVQAIITQAKEEGRDSISDEQKEVLKAYAQEQREARFDALPSNIQEILTKAKEDGRDSLTDEDKETLKEYRQENPDAFPGKKGGKGKHHPRIDLENAPAEIQAIVEQAKEDGKDSLTDEQKETLKSYHQEQRQAKFDALPSNIQEILTQAKEQGRDSLTDEQKETIKSYKQENPDAFPGKKGGKKGPRGER